MRSAGSTTTSLEFELEKLNCSANVETHITDLPNEILLVIFGHLSTMDLLKNVAPVSKRFHILTKTTGVVMARVDAMS